MNFKLSPVKSLIFFLLSVSIQSFTQTTPQPNIIFILADDIGYDLLSVNGSKSYSTPNIDSMAHHGINFTHCEATPLCSPSRHMLLTGKYNFRNYSNGSYMYGNEKTFGNLMHDAGYKTAFYGKLQFPLNPSSMQNWGFDDYSVFDITEDSIATLRYKNPTLVDKTGHLTENAVDDKYCDDILTNHVLDFIDDNSAKPFFIYYAMSLGHEPFCPTPNDESFKSWNPGKGKSDTSYFHSMVTYMDTEVGRIMKKLSGTGLASNTIVIFAGDNGTPTEIYYNVNNLKHVKGQKGITNERGTHVPLIAYWPRHIRQGLVNDDLVDFSDFFPTFAQAINKKDISKYGTLDGLSFYSRMLGKNDTAKQQLFYHYDPHPGFSKLKRWVRDKTYKLYQATADEPAAFYNIINDEKEKTPLTMLTGNEVSIKKRFQKILDSMPSWQKNPDIENPFMTNITNSSATITATILNSGETKLIDRGSTIMAADNSVNPDISQHRIHSSEVALGTFSATRTSLNPQTEYSIALYAMNANASHSTAYAATGFYTFSNPPVLQPAYLKAIPGNGSVFLKWGSAMFPDKGATQKGYAMFYSTDSVRLIKNLNGNDPSKISVNATFVSLATNNAANKLDTSVLINNLTKNTIYNFLLVPYTWDGANASTCNYLIKNALSAKANSVQTLFSINNIKKHYATPTIL